MSSHAWISHHLFVAAAVQESHPGSQSGRNAIAASIELDNAVVEGFPDDWNRFARRREPTRLLRDSGIGGGTS
jgi:hypothetical protein